MADLARLKRMAPFRDMSGAEFRSMVDELRTLVPRAASGATGQMSTLRGTAVRTRFQSAPAVVPPIHLAQVCLKDVVSGVWTLEYTMCKLLQNQPSNQNILPVAGGTPIAVLMFPPGQLYKAGSWIMVFKATFPGEESEGDRTAWIGTAMIRGWDWPGQYWLEPDCAIEECGEDVPPDGQPTWPEGSCS